MVPLQPALPGTSQHTAAATKGNMHSLLNASTLPHASDHHAVVMLMHHTHRMLPATQLPRTTVARVSNYPEVDTAHKSYCTQCKAHAAATNKGQHAGVVLEATCTFSVVVKNRL